MSWLILIVVAHLFYAFVFVVDKYILSRPMPQPVVYAFYVGVLGVITLVLAPFGFSFPTGAEVFWCLLAGAAQVIALIMFYKILNKAEISTIVPFNGALSSIFVLILNSIFTKEFLTSQQMIAFGFLVLGSFVIGFKKREFLGKGVLVPAIFSSFLFALFWVITKYLFLGTNFISGLIWVRIGVVLITLTLLLSKNNRRMIIEETKKTKLKLAGFFFLGRILNVAGSLFLYLAVFLGSVTLINALQGLQYVFILFLAIILAKRIPELKEQFNREVLVQKIIAVILICFGLVFLVI